MSDQPATVERLGVEAVPSRPRRPVTPLHAVEPSPSPPPPAPEPPPPATVYVPQRPSAHDLIVANLKTVAMLLSARALLLLSILGAFVLALGAMSWQSPMGLYVLIAWCCLTILPMAWLEFAGRARRPGSAG